MAFSDTEIRALFCRAGHLSGGSHSHLDELGFSGEGVKTDYFFPPSSEVPYELITPRPEDNQIGPAGFDLRVGTRIAHSDTLRYNVTPTIFESMKPKEIGPEQVLKYDRDGHSIYYIASREKIRLPRNLEVIIDAKSTTGRVGCMCHNVGATYEGEGVIAVQPFAFPIKITSGKTKLFQAIIRNLGTPFMSLEELKKQDSKVRLSHAGKNIFQEMLTPNGMRMTFSTKAVYEAKECKEPIDIDGSCLDWTKYFKLVKGNSEIHLKEKTLYLFGSNEEISLNGVCGRLSRENEQSGTGLWSHFAGFFMPGFSGEVTLECYSLSKRVICSGEPVGFVIFDKVTGPICEAYEGSYQNQKAPRLARMFKQD